MYGVWEGEVWCKGGSEETVEALKDMDHAPPGVRLFSEFFKYVKRFEVSKLGREAEGGSHQRLIRIRDVLRI